MKRVVLLIFLAIVSVNIVFAQRGTALIKVMITLDHSNWTYKLSEKAKFSVQVLKYGSLIENVSIDYQAGTDERTFEKKSGVVLQKGIYEFVGKLQNPGFYRLRVWAVVDGIRYEGIATAAFEPDKITPKIAEPTDFDAFWTKAIADAQKIELDPTIKLLPERCDNKVNVYEISFQNNALKSRMFGILCIPKKTGKFPAKLKVPGAGVRPYFGDVQLASLGVITLEMGIHGIPVTMNEQVYDNLANGALSGYYFKGLDDKDNFYYKRVIVGCIKAIDFIYSLPEFNGSDLWITGGSQGGGLTLALAGLDKRVTAIAANYPAMCDKTRYFDTPNDGYWRSKQIVGEGLTLSYYDGVNFAKRIKIPTLFSFGFNDLAVAPTTMFAAYNTLKCPKQLYIYQDTGHWTYPEQDIAISKWLSKQLNM